MIKVDYHFHPNFTYISSFLTKKRALKLWDKFTLEALDFVVCTEHVFRRPVKAYQNMIKYRPANHNTILLPGLEYITSEGIDLIVFSKNPSSVFGRQDLLNPFLLSVEEVFNLVKSDSDLKLIVPHPSTPSSTGILRVMDLEKLDELYFDGIMLESSNYSFLYLNFILKKLRFNFLLKRLNFLIENTLDFEHKGYLEKYIKVFASDAHVFSDIGNCTLIKQTKTGDLDYDFNIITTIEGKPLVSSNGNFKDLIFAFFTILKEGFLKKTRLYRIDKRIR
ncbi:hypothetical protein CL656_02175 [bacterium]|nr:hypothetical protein [bacterium]|tara:strand:+ start:2336 stop:3169 length:834 start_codon:yes stop_codon:yes gene_type:complete